MDAQETYLRAILATVARQTFSPETLTQHIGTASRDKHFRAFNLCDGTKTQSEIAKEIGLDQSNFSKAISRWVDLGIIVRIKDGSNFKPVHVYPLSETAIKKALKE